MSNKFNFVLVPYRPGQLFRQETITIRPKCQVAFSAAFRDAHDVARFRSVVPYYDKKRQLIVLRLTNDEGKAGAFPIRWPGYFEARRFFRSSGLDVSKLVGRYSPIKRQARKLGIEEPGEVFVIDLKRGRRKSKDIMS